MTKKKSTSSTAVADPPTLDADTQSVVDQFAKLAHAAESLLTRLASGERLDANQWSLLRRFSPNATEAEFRRWKDKEVGRLGGVARWQREAGTAAERKASDDAAKDAAATLEKRGPEIEKQIAELQDELSALQRTATETDQAAKRRRTAVSQLTEQRMLPTFVQDEIRNCVAAFSETQRELEQLRSRLSAMERLGKLDTSDARFVDGRQVGGEDLESILHYVETCEAFGRNRTERLDKMGLLVNQVLEETGEVVATRLAPEKLDRQAWKKYLAGPVAEEIEELRQRIAPLEEAEREHMEEVSQLQSYYVPG